MWHTKQASISHIPCRAIRNELCCNGTTQNFVDRSCSHRIYVAVTGSLVCPHTSQHYPTLFMFVINSHTAMYGNTSAPSSCGRVGGLRVLVLGRVCPLSGSMSRGTLFRNPCAPFPGLVATRSIHECHAEVVWHSSSSHDIRISFASVTMCRYKSPRAKPLDASLTF